MKSPKATPIEKFVTSFSKRAGKEREALHRVITGNGMNLVADGIAALIEFSDATNETTESEIISKLLKSAQKGNNKTITHGTRDLLNAAKNAEIISRDSTKFMHFVGKKASTAFVTADSEITGSMTRELVGADVSHDINFAVNAKILIDVLGFFSHCPQVTIHVYTHASPLYITAKDDQNRVAILMPARMGSIEDDQERWKQNEYLIAHRDDVIPSKSVLEPVPTRGSQSWVWMDETDRYYQFGRAIMFDGYRYDTFAKCEVVKHTHVKTGWTVYTCAEKPGVEQLAEVESINAQINMEVWKVTKDYRTVDITPDEVMMIAEIATSEPAPIVYTRREPPTRKPSAMDNYKAPSRDVSETDPRAEIMRKYAWIEAWEADPKKRMYKSTIHNGKVNRAAELAALPIDVTEDFKTLKKVSV